MTAVNTSRIYGRGVTARLDRLALRPVRAGAERAVDSVLAGPLPETIVRSLVEHDVPERVLRELLEAIAPDGKPDERLQQLVDTLAGHVVRSPAFKQATVDLLRSPEVRAALTEQTSGFAEDFARAARRRAARDDDLAEAVVARGLRRPRAAGPASRYGGFASRGAALVVDAALAQLAFLVVEASLALVGALASVSHTGWLAVSASAAGWAIVMTLYFVGFWSTTGQTPGMRLLGVRVVDGRGGPPSAPRSLVRLVGLVLAIIPLGAGFLPALVDRRRRALQDYLASTQVMYA
jgi:uncharacterized RDD family membrane protein YckC